ncbi:STAS domain-containing protein [Streptomyces sp. NPDC016845]|uniref:STAS domain-containing protein n=1 Tax=Streptomyces sp. NPDC016845 TaxID=3364972 RepID=UPI003799D03A
MTPQNTAGPAGPSEPDGLAVTARVQEGVLVLGLAGTPDHTGQSALHRALEAADPSLCRIVCDLEQLTFMDSTGINLFLIMHRRAGQQDGWLRLTAAPEPVLRTLQLVGLDQVISLHPTVAHALNA